LKGDQQTDNISNGQQLSRQSLPILLYYLFSLLNILLIQFYACLQMAHLVLPVTLAQTFGKLKEPFYATKQLIILRK